MTKLSGGKLILADEEKKWLFLIEHFELNSALVPIGELVLHKLAYQFRYFSKLFGNRKRHLEQCKWLRVTPLLTS